jgi:acetyl-CoA acetyltransferase
MLLDDPWSYYAGGTPESNHELMMRAYIKKYGIKGQDLEKLEVALAQVAVKNHANGAKNKYAQFQRKITLDQVLNARKAAHKPLGLYDFAPVSDGATAVVLTSETVANKMTNRPVFVLAVGAATDYLNYTAREDLSRFLAAEIAMKKATQTAKVDASDLQLIELNDQSTMMELVSLEDLGFCPPGTAWKSIYESSQNGQLSYELGGKPVYVNTDGGLKADGNPLGATGGAQVYEVYRQLRGEAAERQITLPNGLRHGGTVEFEGFGTKAYVTILGEKTQ